MATNAELKKEVQKYKKELAEKKEKIKKLSQKQPKPIKRDKVRLTFKPQYSTKTQITIVLQKKEMKIVGGQPVYGKVPLIPGLPERLTVKLNQVIEVTKEQFEQLFKYGHILEQTSLKENAELFQSIKGTFPETFSVKQHNITEKIADPRRVSQIYDDKLRLVED